MPLQDLCRRNIEIQRGLIDSKRAKGQDTTIDELELKVQEVGLAMVKGAERLEMFDESRDDHYSARRAGVHYRAAADLMHEVARTCEALGLDPHSVVLREAGIKDT